jgi:hypothetical protein
MIRLLKSHTQAWPKLFFTSVEAQTDMVELYACAVILFILM